MPSTRSDKPEILFVCIHNADGSQMAAALLDHLSVRKSTYSNDRFGSVP